MADSKHAPNMHWTWEKLHAKQPTPNQNSGWIYVSIIPLRVYYIETLCVLCTNFFPEQFADRKFWSY